MRLLTECASEHFPGEWSTLECALHPVVRHLLGKKRERMMLCVQTNKSFLGAFSTACPIIHFDFLVFIPLFLKLYLPYFFSSKR